MDCPRNMDTSICITNPQWERYSAKTLSEKELRSLERHVAGCEICADIKEGIDAMKNPATLSQRVNQIHEAVDRSLAPSKNKMAFWYWSAAAVLLISIGISWFLLGKQDIVATNDTEKTISDHTQITKPENTGVEKIKTDTQVNTATDNTRVLAERNNEVQNANSGATAAPASKAEDVEVESTKPAVAAAEDMSSNDDAKDAEYKTKNLYTKTPPVMIPADKEVDLRNTQALDSVRKEEMLAKETSMKEESESAKEKYVVVTTASASKRKTTKKNSAPRETYPAANNRTDNANGNVSERYKNLSDSTEYRIAQINYDSAQYDKCIANLADISINPNSEFYEQGLLLKAKALLKQNQKEQARVALKTVISLHKTKEKEAQELLNTIK